MYIAARDQQVGAMGIPKRPVGRILSDYFDGLSINDNGLLDSLDRVLASTGCIWIACSG